VAFAAAGIVVTTVGSALAPVIFDPTGIRNPVGIDVGEPLKDVLGAIDGVSGLLVFGLAVIGVVLRYRRGTSVERLQLRWFVVPAALALVCFGIGSLIVAGPVGDIAWITGIASLTAIPIAIGIAILRYRLYEIDVLLNRTAVYATVTAILVAAFAVANLALQEVVTASTGARSELLSGALGVVVGLLFVPIRTRVRPIVDRFLPGRAIVALLFTDIVGSTETLVEIGDERWRGLLEQYLAAVRQQLARHRGHEINTAGDAFFATFNRPLDAVQAAWAIRDSLEGLGLRTRTGLHLGEVEMRGEQVSGLAVHTAARVMAAAGEGEVLASDALREALTGASVTAADRGTHALKGVPGAWQLYAVEAAG
jgi:class 3 adenylate cyclase